MLLVDCLPADAQDVSHLLPGPAELSGSGHLHRFKAIGELPQGADGSQAGAGVVPGYRVNKRFLAHTSTSKSASGMPR
jgi:hypothetical protein